MASMQVLFANFITSCPTYLSQRFNEESSTVGQFKADKKAFNFVSPKPASRTPTVIKIFSSISFYYNSNLFSIFW